MCPSDNHCPFLQSALTILESSFHRVCMVILLQQKYKSKKNNSIIKYLTYLLRVVCISGVTGPGPTRACARASTRNTNDVHLLIINQRLVDICLLSIERDLTINSSFFKDTI